MKLNIKDRVDKLSISKNKLAKLLDISYPTLQEMYRGTSVSIRLDTLEKLCLILQCTPNDILQSDKFNNTNNSNLDETTKDTLEQLVSLIYENNLLNSDTIKSQLDDTLASAKNVYYHYYKRKLDDHKDIILPYLVLDSSKDTDSQTNNNSSHEDVHPKDKSNNKSDTE